MLRPEVAPWARLRPDLAGLRLAAALAASTLALSSNGDALTLAVALGVAAASVWSGFVGLLVAGAVATRWGTLSMSALAGAQSVLGPAVTVGPSRAAAASGLAAAAVALAARSPQLIETKLASAARTAVHALPFAAAGAAVAAGPGPGGDVWVRVGATVVGVALCAGIAVGCRRRAVDVSLTALAVVLAVASVVLSVGARA